MPKGASGGLGAAARDLHGAGRRRSWTSAQKAAIAAESFEDGALVGHVARRHGLTPQQLFNWRRQARREADEGTGAPAVCAGGRRDAESCVAARRERREQTGGCASPCHRTGHRGIERLDLARRRGRNGDCDHPRVESGEVIGPSGAVRVMVATKPVDFRKGAEGLAALVRDVMGADPFSGAVYVFRAKRRRPGEAGLLGRHGVCLFAKRLEDGQFQWPKIENGVIRLSAAQLSALLEGLDWRRVGAAKDTPAPRLPG